MPFAAFSRTIRLITRSDELGSLPEKLAQLTRQLLIKRLEQELALLPGWIGHEMTILGNDGEPIRQAVASASVQA